MRKTKRVKRKKLSCAVAIEIAREDLTMVIVHRRDDDNRDVQGFKTRWLRQAPSLNSEQGVAELTSAISELVEQNKLHGGTVNVALSGDFCVTRVLAGETDKMKSEMTSLRDRSAHYLLLGAGPKAVSESIRTLDMKNSQGWLTVTNRETLDQIVTAVEGAGLCIGVIEHSMIAVSRALGRMGGDSSSPTILIEPSERGVDLGISYRGELLFDYRPGGIHSKEHIATIVEKHLERIQRYATRFFKFAGGQINRVYLVGNRENAELVQKQFDKSERLTAEVLNPVMVCPDWRYDEWLVANPDFSAPLGAAMVEHNELGVTPDTESPNLMQVYRSQRDVPVWPLLRKHFWPLAVAASIGFVMYGAALVRHAQARGIESEVAAAEAESIQAKSIKLRMDQALVREKYLKVLERDLVNPRLHELVLEIVKSKPSGVYLSKITLDHESTLLLLGTANDKEYVYDFQDKLKSIPVLENLAIAAMKNERIPSNENATGFQIRCKFTASNDFAEGRDSNG